MKYFKLLIVAVVLISIISCDLFNCKKWVLYTNIYSINLSNNKIKKHCSIGYEGEPWGEYEYNKYYYTPDRNQFLYVPHDWVNLIIDVYDMESGEKIYTLAKVTTTNDTPTINFSSSGYDVTFAENFIYTVSIDGNNLMGHCYGSFPNFSPDDASIVFVDTFDNLSILNLELNEVTELLHDDNIKYPMYHPNGHKIYYWSNNGLNSYSLLDSLATNLFPNPLTYYDKMISISNSGDNKIFSQDNSLYSIDADDNVTDLFTNGIYPHISNDGSKVIYLDCDMNKIYLMNFDGSNKIELCNNSSKKDNTCFSEDDNEVFYINTHWGWTSDYCH